MFMRKLKSTLRRTFFRYCPSKLLRPIIRNMIQLDYEYDPNLVVKIAETKEELEGAFRVLYQSYIEMGYCQKSESEIQLTLHHALPTTSVIIAKHKDEVVGTLSLVRNNNLKLPCENIWNIEGLNRYDRRVAEITSLAIDKRFRRSKSGNIFFPLLKFMYEFSTDYFGTQILTIVVHPKERAFYEAIFFFRALSEEMVADYYGAPAIALFLDIKKSTNHGKKIYGGKTASKNLYHYLTQFKSKNLIMPKRNSFSVDYPVLDKTMFQYFFFEKSEIGHGVNEETLEKILRHFPGPNGRRVSSRFAVDIPAHLIDPETGKCDNVMIKNVSATGLRIVNAQHGTVLQLESMKVYQLEFFSGEQIFPMNVVNQWCSGGIQAGFRVISNQLNWHRFLKTIHFKYLSSQEILNVFQSNAKGSCVKRLTSRHITQSS